MKVKDIALCTSIRPVSRPLTSVNAEVVNASLEIRDIRIYLRVELEFLCTCVHACTCASVYVCVLACVLLSDKCILFLLSNNTHANKR